MAPFPPCGLSRDAPGRTLLESRFRRRRQPDLGKLSPGGDPLNLEARFEADFAKHLDQKGAKRGSSSPATSEGDERIAWASSRPTLRRLKYLVKWGQWQLLAYDGAPADLRMAVLDAVVRAFSPWVQRSYLLNTSFGTATELNEVSQHLTPLYSWLARRASFRALEEAVQSVGVAALLGAVEVKHVNMVRVVFATILETATFFNCLGLEAIPSPKPSKSTKEGRLYHGIAAIGAIVERPDVVHAVSSCASGSFGQLAAFTAIAPGLPASPSRESVFMVPPEGAEDEAGSETSELDFYSCSDSEGEALLARPLWPTLSDKVVEVEGSCPFDLRSALFPRGEGGHSWRPVDPSSFMVRSATYLKDKRKVAAAFSMLDLVSVEMMHIGPTGSVPRVALHHDFYPAWARKHGDRRFHFIQNWILPGYQAVIVAALDPEAPWLASDTPQARVWCRFLEMNLDQHKTALKTIIAIDEGPWLVRRAVPKKPLLAGNQLKTQTYHIPKDHFEVVTDVSSGGKAEQVAVHLVMKALKNLRLSMAVMLEGKTEEELPEALLWAAGFSGVDTAKLRCPRA